MRIRVTVSTSFNYYTYASLLYSFHDYKICSLCIYIYSIKLYQFVHCLLSLLSLNNHKTLPAWFEDRRQFYNSGPSSQKDFLLICIKLISSSYISYKSSSLFCSLYISKASKNNKKS